MDRKTDLLITILDCGYIDLNLLENCEYSMYDITDYCTTNFGKINFSLIIESIFNIGQSNLLNEIKNRIEELKQYKEISIEEQTELEELRKLDVYEDITMYFNYLDTHIYINRNVDIYTEYLQDKLEAFESNTGINIQY